MSSYNLPIILVSASDNTVASKIISELVDNEVEDNMYKEMGWRVWQLENKYYTAQVRLQALLDGDTLPLAPLAADAHLIYLTENEGEDAAEARSSRAAPLLRRGAVRLTLLDAAHPTDTLVSWGLRARHEVVALREAEAEAEGADEVGMTRARAALHAHVWPGLRRRDAAITLAPDTARSDDEESSDGGGFEEEEDDAVERAEAFADALGVLAALGEQRGAPPGDHDDHLELRRERAEQLVAAFCRALGHDLHSC